MSLWKTFFNNFFNSKEQPSHKANINSQPPTLNNRKTIKRYSVDFAHESGVDLQNAELVFGDSKPGTFLLNGVEKSIIGNYVDDAGMSSDNKYHRIYAGQFAFWVTPKDFPAFLTDLKDTLKDWKTKLNKYSVTFENYLGSEQAYKEQLLQFNASGVSHDYGIPARHLIAKLKPGDSIQLVLDEETTNPNEKIALLTMDCHQIGWLPLTDLPSPLDDALLKQLEAGIILYAKVEETGIIQGKAIRWCSLVFPIKVPYSKQEEMVYVAPSGYVYHRNSHCNSRVTEEIPLSWALQSRMKPCKKCCKAEFENSNPGQSQS